MRGLGLIAQPLVIAFSMRFRVFYDGVAVLNANRIIEPPHSSGAAPEVSELPVTVQVDGVPDDVMVNMGLVNVCADDKSIVALGESPGQLLAQPVCFLRRNLAGDKSPFARKQFFTLKVAVNHDNRGGVIVQVTDNHRHGLFFGQLTGPVAAVSGYQCLSTKGELSQKFVFCDSSLCKNLF